MEKIKKSYIERLNDGLVFNNSSVIETENRDPLQIINDGRIQCFRFFDQEFIIDEDEEYEGKKSNYSSWTFFGTRISIDELKTQYKNNPDFKDVIDNLEERNIKYVCKTQTGSMMPMKDGDVTFEELTSNKQKENEILAKKMFDKLREHIGEDVSYTGWWYGAKQEETGILKNVEDFFNVAIGSYGIPFVGYGAAISEIVSKDGEVLYTNPYIEENYDRRDDNEIYASKRLIFGDRIVNQEIEEQEKNKKEWQEWQEQQDKKAKKDKYSLMREGLTLVKPETVDEWLEFVDNNCNDGYSSQVVRAAISMMKKLNEGMSFEEAEHKVYNEELGLTGFLSTSTASTLAHFAKQSEEYRKYWNKQFGVEYDEEKGIVNPTVLAFKKKSN